MRHRAVASFGVLLVAIAVTVVATRSVAGQAPASPAKPAAAKKWTVPRTPDGQPDLQGFWTNSTYVPLERPNNVAKAIYTEQEFAAMIMMRRRAKPSKRSPAPSPTCTTTSRSLDWTGANRPSSRRCAPR